MAALTENGEGKKEISMFFVRADAEGVKAGGHEDKMGIRTSDTCDVILEEIYRTAVKAPISCGDIVLKDVCHTGVDIVSTATLE